MEQQITPEKVTKPIQLLAAWLIGLIAIDASFLATAGLLKTSSILPAVLVVAAVANVPLFVLFIFLMQTRFRPEMQDDSFYSQYLKSLSTKQDELQNAQEKLVQQQRKQSNELNDINLLLGTLLSDGERQLLLDIVRGETKDREGSGKLADELRGLRKRNLLSRLPNRKIAEVEKARAIDLADVVTPTELGRRLAARIGELERDEP